MVLKNWVPEINTWTIGFSMQNLKLHNPVSFLKYVPILCQLMKFDVQLEMLTALIWLTFHQCICTKIHCTY